MRAFRGELNLNSATKPIAGVLVVLLCFSLGIFASRLVDRRLTLFLEENLQSLRQKYGLQIQVGGVQLEFGKLVLTDIAVGDENWLVIDRVEAGVSWIPWRDFLKPTRLTIGRAYMKLPWSIAKWPKNLQDLWNRWSNRRNRPSTEGSLSGDRTLRKLPKLIQLHAAHVEFTEQSTQKLLLDDLSFSLLPEDEVVRVRLGKSSLNGVVAENLDFYGKDFLKNDLKIIVGSQQQVNAPKNSWKVDCDVNREKIHMSCQANLKTIPDFVQAQLKSFLGEKGAAQYTGKFEVQKMKNSNRGWILTLDGVVHELSLERRGIGAGVVGPFHLGVQSRLVVNLEQKSLATKDTLVSILPSASSIQDGIPASVSFNLNYQEASKQVVGSLEFHLDEFPCRRVFKVLPASFIPDIYGFRLGGTAKLNGQVIFSGQDADIKLQESNFNCSVTESPEIYSRSYLNGSFMIERETPRGNISIPVDPERPNFTDVKKLPSHVRSAFVSAEDAGFYQHQGVELSAIIGAAEKNVHEGRAAVGGSTITMQTVKNLYLARDKTISRKAQEVFLAWHIEREISKDRILEIYLNMVEFGPNIYGIGEASRIFFAKFANQLTLKESVYLASLLPAPVPRIRYYCKGQLTENYDALVNQLLDRMLSLGRINHLDYMNARDETLKFSDLERDRYCTKASTK